MPYLWHEVELNHFITTGGSLGDEHSINGSVFGEDDKEVYF